MKNKFFMGLILVGASIFQLRAEVGPVYVKIDNAYAADTRVINSNSSVIPYAYVSKAFTSPFFIRDFNSGSYACFISGNIKAVGEMYVGPGLMTRLTSNLSITVQNFSIPRLASGNWVENSEAPIQVIETLKDSQGAVVLTRNLNIKGQIYTQLSSKGISDGKLTFVLPPIKQAPYSIQHQIRIIGSKTTMPTATASPTPTSCGH